MSDTNGSHAEGVVNGNTPAGSDPAGSEVGGSGIAGNGAAARRRASPAQSAASRANSRKSTGPRTNAGKRKSSQNALRGSFRRLLGEAESGRLASRQARPRGFTGS